MALHRLSHIVVGVPDVEENQRYYSDFGLTLGENGRFSTREGGEQFKLVQTPRRQVVELGVAADDTDDLDRIAAGLTSLGSPVEREGQQLTTDEPASGFRVVVSVLPRLRQEPVAATPDNGPGRTERTGRAPGVARDGKVMPRRLGHAVVGTTDLAATMAFFTQGLGFKVSDHIGDQGAFMRCSTDHHNVLALAAPVNYLHHTSWQVDDIDDVGRGAFAMLEGNPERHVWGLGRHHAGSNFFWYLKDPAGNFSEYFSDMDVIPEDEIWEPEVLEGARGLFNWGPQPPASFLEPEDLAAMMTGNHSG